LSSGFILRVLLGCALVGVTPSNWLLLCSSTLALFMALTKRKAELVGAGADHRPSLAGYNALFLDQAIGITAGMTLVAYALYSKEAEVLQPGREFASLPFVVFGVLEYLRISHTKGRGGTPIELVFSAPSLLLAGIGWAAATVWSLGLL
jgi:decaprenyl-phosphate phosphoribosyltransferase